MIEDCVRTLARKHSNVRFVRLHYQDAEMEPAGVPALIAYRGGDKFAGLVPIMEEMPDDAELSSLTLEAVMLRYVRCNFTFRSKLWLTYAIQTPDLVMRLKRTKKKSSSIPPSPLERVPHRMCLPSYPSLSRSRHFSGCNSPFTGLSLESTSSAVSMLSQVRPS
jgi:hypothetical protein